MLKPLSVVDVIVPVPSALLPSLKMFRTSICFDSGGCVPIANSGPSFSPGSLRPSFSERSAPDRKSTRLNSSHQIISYAVFCLKKKKKERKNVNQEKKKKKEKGIK